MKWISAASEPFRGGAVDRWSERFLRLRRGTSGKASPVISEIPLTCAHCGKATVKTVDWIQQNTFFTCDSCATAVMIDKDMAAQLLAQLELAQRR
jgi:hypothetical protein